MTDQPPTTTDQNAPPSSIEKAAEAKGLSLVHVPQNGRDDRRSDPMVLPDQAAKAPSFSYRTAPNATKTACCMRVNFGFCQIKFLQG